MTTSTASRKSVRTPSGSKEIRFRESVAVRRPADDLYAFWRDLSNLPRIMSHLKKVTVTGPLTSHWVAKAPAGREVSWDARIIADEPARWLAWRSEPGAGVENEGVVSFTPGETVHETIVTVELAYIPPGGWLGEWIARLYGEEPEQQVSEDLARFRFFMEDGQPEKDATALQSGGPL
jgi:uncharacterized membrane protein